MFPGYPSSIHWLFQINVGRNHMHCGKSVISGTSLSQFSVLKEFFDLLNISLAPWPNWSSVSKRRLLWSTLCWLCTKMSAKIVPLPLDPTGHESPRGDYCEAPLCWMCTKMSAKKWHFTQNWHKCHFTPFPKSETLADLELSSQVGLQISKCQFTPPPPAPKVKRWHILADLEIPSLVGLQISKVPLPPSEKFTDLSGILKVKLDFRFQSANLPPPLPPESETLAALELSRRWVWPNLNKIWNKQMSY